MYEKQILEKWLYQIKTDSMRPEFIGAGLNKDQAIKRLQEQIKKISSDKSVMKTK